MVVIRVVMDVIQSYFRRVFHVKSKLLMEKGKMLEIVSAIQFVFYFKQRFQIKLNGRIPHRNLMLVTCLHIDIPNGDSDVDDNVMMVIL